MAVQCGITQCCKHRIYHRAEAVQFISAIDLIGVISSSICLEDVSAHNSVNAHSSGANVDIIKSPEWVFLAPNQGWQPNLPEPRDQKRGLQSTVDDRTQET